MSDVLIRINSLGSKLKLQVCANYAKKGMNRKNNFLLLWKNLMPLSHILFHHDTAQFEDKDHAVKRKTYVY